MATRTKKLTAQQERTVVALLTERTPEAAAKAAGVELRLLKAWLREPEFKERLREGREQLDELSLDVDLRDRRRRRAARQPLPWLVWTLPLVLVAGGLGAWFLWYGRLDREEVDGAPTEPAPAVAGPSAPDVPDAAATARAEEDRRVEAMRAEADAHYEAGRYVHPPLENAVEGYRRILAVRPDDTHAQARIEAIRAHYVLRAERAERSDAAALARMSYEAALVAAPRDVALANRLERQLDREREQDLLGEHGYVEIPAGPFRMGSPPDAARPPAEAAGAEVEVAGFAIDWGEVTVAAYRKCVRLGKCSSEKAKSRGCNWYDIERGNHPMNCVDWDDARRYCESVGKRLPTEAEWEKAARGTDGRLYPWGNVEPDCEHATMSGCGGATRAVGTAPVGLSAFGVADLAGNVREWTADAHVPGKTARVVRGGSFADGATAMRSSARVALEPTARDPQTGFRCARSLPMPAPAAAPAG